MELERMVYRIREEFREMPGLRLTPAQATRLWGLEARDLPPRDRRARGGGIPALDRYRRGDPRRKLEVRSQK